jgi:hypothetical protein
MNLEKWNSSKLPFPFLPKVHDWAFHHSGHKNELAVHWITTPFLPQQPTEL